MKETRSVLAIVASSLFIAVSAQAAPIPKDLPKQNVVEVPAIGDGLCVSNAFQSNMVIQRDKPIRIWGWAQPGEKVTVSFVGHEATTAAGDDRSWEVTLDPAPAHDTAQTLIIKGKDKSLKLENVLVGDVWILGGQSNMEFQITKVFDGDLEAVSANFPNIRLLSIPRGVGFESVRSFDRLFEWSDWSGRHSSKGNWEVCSPETVTEFSAIGYTFGRRLAMASQVPIGLIDTSWGGTTVEAWTPEETLQNIKEKETQDLLNNWAEKIAAFDPEADLKQQIERAKARGKEIPTEPRPGPAADRNRPGYCFASVIRPLEGLSVKGALFHQGFNNCFSGSAGAKMYYQVFGSMITAWRKNFADPELPFCIISLCTASEPQTEENFLKPMYDVGAYIRDAQYQTFVDFRAEGDENIGFVSSYDQRISWYHPQIKIPVGERAAKWALSSQYDILKGGADNWMPPFITEIKPEDGRIVISLSGQVKMPDDSRKEMVGFAIAGDDRRFFPADISYYTDGSKDKRNRPIYKKDILVLSSPMVPQPKHYRYAWARNPLANIVSNKRVPLATQRSDDWALEETPMVMTPPADMPESQASKWQRGNIQKELQLNDMERLLKEAENTISELKEPFLKQKEDWEKKKAGN